jgi:hypothetical protein
MAKHTPTLKVTTEAYGEIRVHGIKGFVSYEDAAKALRAVNAHELAVKLAKAVLRAEAEGSLKAHMPVDIAEDFLKIAKAEGDFK